jgi:glycosyltransferase involved in cell wall biosynthesis
MHVGVDALLLADDQRGIGRYTWSLLRALPGAQPALSFTLFTAPGREVAVARQVATQLGEGAPVTAAPAAALAARAPDVLWCPWNVLHLPAPTRSAVVAAVHDIAPVLDFDGGVRGARKWWGRRQAARRYARTVARADLLLASSRSTARDLERRFGADPARLRVVPLGTALPAAAGPAAADGAPPPTGAACGPAAAAVTTGRFFLVAGAIEPRKNIDVVLRAMPAIVARHPDVRLVVCGPGPGVARLAQRSGAPAWLDVRGFVDEPALEALYRAAVALLVPSRYEGFGLPVLEAMAAGAAVLCANASSLPEVGGDVAGYFPPDDPAALAASCLALLDTPARRAAMAARGPAHAAGFSWARTAAATAQAFADAVTARRGAAR